MPSSVIFEFFMRASRLLRILLILQNRGRVTTLQLAGELEVARRTVLRDVEALGVMLGTPKTALAQLGLQAAAHRACDKLVESLSDAVRQRVHEAQRRFRFSAPAVTSSDTRVAALAEATRRSLIVRLNAHSVSPRTIHPIALRCRPDGWAVLDGNDPTRPIPESRWGDVNLSARQFATS
jgi:predicted DNA-binding transcriptional regulator YafY